MKQTPRLSPLKLCGPIGALAYLVYRFGNKTVYGSYKKPIFLFRYGIYRVLDLLIVRALASAAIPAKTKIGEQVAFFHDANGIVIHPRVVIGDKVTIFQQVTIGAKFGERGVPTIGDGVTIGAGAKLIGNIRIGNFAQIGANAVVVKDVPDGATAVGIPAKIIPAKPDWQKIPARELPDA